MESSYFSILKSSLLFSDFSFAEISALRQILQAGERHYEKNAHLISAGDPISAFGLLLSGAVQITMDDIDGNHILMANVAPGATFAEAMSCTGVTESPIDAIAAQECTVLWLQGAPLLEPSFLADPLCARFSSSFIRVMADRSLRFNDRIQVLSKKTIREKLITFFSQQAVYQKSHDIVLAMDRSGLADYLGVERSALSRELSNMQKAGMLRFHKNHFTIFHT